MNLLATFIAYIQKEQLFLPNDRLLIAVSGGVDSVVLCELCHQAGYPFEIAHCNFQLRGSESDADEAFVKELGNKYQVQVYNKRFDTNAQKSEKGESIQVMARALRYEWFNELIAQDPRYLLTAHHANDNIETLLMNFFKGTGINGLQGILPKETGLVKQLVRPLLFAGKEELLSFARLHQLTWREDASNNSNAYTRNYFRNELIPSIQQVFPQVETNLLDNIERFRDIHTLYKQAIMINMRSLVEQRGGEWYIPVLKLSKMAALSTVLFEMLKPFGFQGTQIQEVSKLLKSESGKYVSSATHRILKNRKWLIVSALNANTQTYYLIERENEQLHFEDGSLTMRWLSMAEKFSNDNSIAQLDAKDLKFPLLLRKWKQGDYFYPLGIQKKKKLSRFFIDQKLSLLQKEHTWVIESDKKIIWVVGLRIDDRCKVTAATKEVLHLSLLPAK